MQDFNLLRFTTDTKQYRQAGAIIKEKDTLGYHFVNTGSVICFINNLPLYPSGVFDTMITGYKDVSLYNIRFDLTTLPANTELTVITFNQSK